MVAVVPAMVNTAFAVSSADTDWNTPVEMLASALARPATGAVASAIA